MAIVIFSHKKGDLVKISDDLTLTHEFYQVVPSMIALKNKTFKINLVCKEDKIEINNCYWHPNDLIPVSETPVVEGKTFIFDPVDLTL